MSEGFKGDLTQGVWLTPPNNTSVDQCRQQIAGIVAKGAAHGFEVWVIDLLDDPNFRRLYLRIPPPSDGQNA